LIQPEYWGSEVTEDRVWGRGMHGNGTDWDPIGPNRPMRFPWEWESLYDSIMGMGMGMRIKAWEWELNNGNGNGCPL